MTVLSCPQLEKTLPLPVPVCCLGTRVAIPYLCKIHSSLTPQSTSSYPFNSPLGAILSCRNNSSSIVLFNLNTSGEKRQIFYPLCIQPERMRHTEVSCYRHSHSQPGDARVHSHYLFGVALKFSRVSVTWSLLRAQWDCRGVVLQNRSLSGLCESPVLFHKKYSAEAGEFSKAVSCPRQSGSTEPSFHLCSL